MGNLTPPKNLIVEITDEPYSNSSRTDIQRGAVI